MINNTREVGVIEGDSNAIRLPNSAVGEPARGDSAYGPGKNITIRPGALDTKATAGVIGQPTLDSGYGYVPTPQKSADTTNSGTSLNTTYDHANRSILKSPQDIPEKGRNQYEFHG